MTVLVRLEIPCLRRGERRELAAVGLDIQQWRAVEAIEPTHQNGVALDANQLDDRGCDRIGPHRRAQREGATGLLVVLRALQHQVAARLMQPVDHFEIFVEIDALDGRHKRLKNFQPANRAVKAPLPRRLQPRGPGRADAADEHEPGVAGGRQIDGDLALADFTLSYHFLNPASYWADTNRLRGGCNPI